MNDAVSVWNSLDVTAYDIVPVSRGGVPQKIARLRDFLASRSETPTPGRSPAAVLHRSLEFLLNTNVAVEQEYVDLVRALVSICPAVLAEGAPARLAGGAGLVDKIAVFNDLYADKINPTLVKAASKKMLGTYLIELGFVRQEQIDQALADQNAGLFPGKRLGDILQAKAIITRAQLDQAIELQMIDSLEG